MSDERTSWLLPLRLELTSPMATLCSPQGGGGDSGEGAHLALCPDNPIQHTLVSNLCAHPASPAVGTRLRAHPVPTGCSILKRRTQSASADW